MKKEDLFKRRWLRRGRLSVDDLEDMKKTGIHIATIKSLLMREGLQYQFDSCLDDVELPVSRCCQQAEEDFQSALNEVKDSLRAELRAEREKLQWLKASLLLSFSKQKTGLIRNRNENILQAICTYREERRQLLFEAIELGEN